MIRTKILTPVTPAAVGGNSAGGGQLTMKAIGVAVLARVGQGDIRTPKSSRTFRTESRALDVLGMARRPPANSRKYGLHLWLHRQLAGPRPISANRRRRTGVKVSCPNQRLARWSPDFVGDKLITIATLLDETNVSAPV